MNRSGSAVPRIFLLLLISASLGFVAADQKRSLAPWMEQLGNDDFARRVAAEQALLEFSKSDPDAAHELFSKRLETESDPEIRHRLRKLAQTIAFSFPVEQTKFTKVNLEQKIWTLYDDKPKKAASYLFKGETLEYDSTGEISEGLMFIRRFAKPEPDLKADARFFGPRQEPEPQRLVLDAEIKVLKERHDRIGLAGVHMNIEDHRTSCALMILEDRVFTYQNIEVHHMDTTDRWHHYRFVIEGDHQQVYIDDMEKPVFERQRPQRLGRNWATFGDSTAGAGARAQVRNVTFQRFNIDPNAGKN
jgi:hypothetical protein